MLYNALPDEVRIRLNFEKVALRKELSSLPWSATTLSPWNTKETTFAVGGFNIFEPQNEPYKRGDFDLIVIA